MKSTLTFALLLALATTTRAQIHVSPSGDDANPGTAAQPVATVAKAVELADEKGGAQEIVLQEGIYAEAVKLPSKKDAPPLLVTAARGADGDFVEVVFDQGYRITDAEPVEGMPGVYRTPIPESFNNYQSRRSMWETDTRKRYRGMADVRAVAAFPASFRFRTDKYSSPKGYLYFHTSDGRPAAEHKIGFDIGDGGFSLQRDNVTLRGLTFRNGSGLWIVGNNALIEDCEATNIERMAVYISAACSASTVRRFTASDVGAGIYSEGGHTVVEDCRLFRAQDDFESYAETQQDSAGIQLYSPAGSGLIRGNLTVGFRTGIFCKGHNKAVTAENNTCVGGEAGGESEGIAFVHWRPGSSMRNNVVSGHHGAYLVAGFTQYSRDGIFRDNLLWDVELKENITACFTIPQASGSGQGVMMAEPRFAAPALGDFCLLSDSPALRADGSHLGALPVVPDGWQDRQPPTLSLTAAAPATILVRKVELFWASDRWNPGGGAIEERGTTFETEAGNQWMVPASKVRLLLTAHENASRLAQMKSRVGDGAWSAPRPFTWEMDVELPADSVEALFAVMAADEAGNWSEPATLRAFKVTEAPKLVSAPAVYATRYGWVVTFRTDVPCTAKLEWGPTTDYGSTVERPADVTQRWNADDGGEWTEKRTGPRLDHHLAVTAPEVEAGKTVHYRIVLDDGIDHVRQGEDAMVALTGEPRTIILAPDGADAEGADTAKAPWKTLQFAVDRALPGDRIVLRDGIYTEPVTVTRGGLEGAPLVIEAENERRAALDVGKLYSRAIELHAAPWVTLRGLEIRWFDDTGLQFTDSPHVTLENLTFWDNHLIQGRKSGSGFYARRSPFATVRGCLFYFMNESFTLLDSPNFDIRNNTAASMLHRGCRIIYSSRNSTFVNNSFTFTGNDHLQIYEDPADWKTFTCDYNNFAALVRDVAPRRPAPEDDITRWSGAHWAKEAKGVNYLQFAKPEGGWDEIHCFSLKEWQAKSGKDAHSIFKRPMYVNPVEGDWRLQPDSPNLGAGRDGATIGALGVALTK